MQLNHDPIIPVSMSLFLRQNILQHDYKPSKCSASNHNIIKQKTDQTFTLESVRIADDRQVNTQAQPKKYIRGQWSGPWS